MMVALALPQAHRIHKPVASVAIRLSIKTTAHMYVCVRADLAIIVVKSVLRPFNIVEHGGFIVSRQMASGEMDAMLFESFWRFRRDLC
jgi:hypothetical protein